MEYQIKNLTIFEENKNDYQQRNDNQPPTE